ncbi:MAG: hypothetical protein CBB68_15595 [Rhodospirillaceae bacterium TMED8]|nr:hypothetical protein [Magnetovibrio sp.]OUT47842.1 MAG: hypothetical protein CBB68_15595 [Rhodospirillaceae bacterium TMED8]|tara:strand:- start:802 stop:1902 length:1101 start_codon:yes stop_codon:yes gene_type:complete
MEDIPTIFIVSFLGLVLGLFFGITAQRTNFCTMGAISDVVFMGDWNRFRAWMLSIAVAIIGSQALHISGILDLGNSIYLNPNLGWVGAIIGGLLFGFGMTLAGGCGNKTLVRLGAGNLKSLVVVLFIGIFAYMTLRGITGLARVEIENAFNTNLEIFGMTDQSLPAFIHLFGFTDLAARLGILVIIVGGLLGFVFKSAEFRASKTDLIGGLFIGLMVPAAWYVTGVLGVDDFEPTPLTSLSFVAPVGESIQYLMTFTGSTINFGVAVVFGVIFGSFISAKLTGDFRIEAFTDPNDMLRHMIGGSIMGIGGVMALGCTVGQGITGMSTLAAGSLLALLAILLGGYFGMKYMEEGTYSGALRAIFARQ